MTRRLSPAELQQVIELYHRGLSTYQLARQFGTDRHTITRHLRNSGVGLRPRQKLTPQLAEQVKRLYAEGHSLALIGKQVGLTPRGPLSNRADLVPSRWSRGAVG